MAILCSLQVYLAVKWFIIFLISNLCSRFCSENDQTCLWFIVFLVWNYGRESIECIYIYIYMHKLGMCLYLMTDAAFNLTPLHGTHTGTQLRSIDLRLTRSPFWIWFGGRLPVSPAGAANGWWLLEYFDTARQHVSTDSQPMSKHDSLCQTTCHHSSYMHLHFNICAWY